MYRSSMKLIILSALSIAFLAGCSLPKPESRQDNGDSATFYVKDSSIEISQSILDKNLSIPTGKTFNFKACLTDNKRSKEIITHEFKVIGADKEITLQSDKNGCVIWAENIGFNAMAKAQFIKIDRTIKAQGIHKGQKTVSFAINPWESVAYALQSTSVPNLVEGEVGLKALAGDGISNSLWFDDLRLTIEEKKTSAKGITLNFEIRTQPGLAMETSAGRRLFEPLTYGEFNVTLALIHAVSEDQKEVRRLLENPIHSTAKMSSSYLFIETPIVLSRICTRGQVQLGLKIEPVNAPKNVKTFEGVFIIGDCDSIKGNMFSRLKNAAAKKAGEFTLDGYLTDKTGIDSVTPSNETTTLTDTEQPDYYQNGQIEIKRLSFNNVGYKDQRTIIKDRIFNISACMKSGLDQKAMRAQTFEIKKVNGETTKVRTNDDGCLSWDDSYQFNYFAQESWKETSVTISNSNLGVNQTIKLHINPWSSNESFLRDVRFVDSQGQKLLTAKGQSEIILTSYEFDKKAYSYEIDQFMNIKVKKQGLLKLSPRLKRPTLTESTGFVEENLPIGKYLLKWAIVDMASAQDLRKANSQIYQTGQQVITNNGSSTFVENITFETKNVKAMGNTNQLVLEIYPLVQNPKVANAIELDLDAEIAVSVFRGAIILANNNEGGILEVYEKSGRSVVDALTPQLKKFQGNYNKLMTAMATKELFAKNEKLEILTMNKPATTLNLRRSLVTPVWKELPAKHSKFSEYDAAKFQKWFDTGIMDQEMGTALCGYWFSDRLQHGIKNLGHVEHQRLLVGHITGAFDLSNLCRYTDGKPMTGIEIKTGYHRTPRTDFTGMFTTEFRYFVKNPSLVTGQPLSASAKEFSVNNAFNLVKSFGHSLSKTMAWDASMGLKVPGLDILSASTGVKYSVAHSETTNEGTGSATSFQSGISGIMEKLTFAVKAEAYEKCLVVRLNSNLFDGPKSPLGNIENNRLTTQVKMDILTSGLMICEGQVRKQAMPFNEDYYFVNQRILPLQSMDPSSDATRPFFAAIRGYSDFTTFMTFLQAQYGVPETSRADTQNKELTSDKLKDAFKTSVPTYPGQYIRTPQAPKTTRTESNKANS